MKIKEWIHDRPLLIERYKQEGITYCEGSSFNSKCMGDFGLAIHHLDRRSSGKAKNTFEDTRLLCAHCHHRADQAPGFKQFNNLLRTLR